MNSSGSSAEAEYDVVVVGSGAGGMTAALAAHARGMRVLVVEKSAYFGGSSARSGGGIWAPNSAPLVREGQRDDPARLLEYMDRIAGDRVPRERIVRYLDGAPAMVDFLEGLGGPLADGFFWIRGYSDYRPELGGNPLGRGVWARPIDRRLLGDEMAYLHPGVKRMQLPLGAWITSVDLHDLLAIRWGGLGHKKILGKLAWRIARARVTGERIGVSGQALATRLRLAMMERDLPLWRETPMTALLTDGDGRVTGVEVERDGVSTQIPVKRAVVLASGGFDHNLEMRKRYQPGIDRDWSLGSPTNEGDGIRIGEELGGAVDLMDEAWWMPTMPAAMDGSLVGLVAERQYPGQFIVNGAGERFVNEAAPYVVFCKAQLAGHRGGVSHIPAWMIIDERAWKRNIIAGHLPGAPVPRPWVEKGVIHTGRTFEELAKKIGVPPAALRETADRFNGFARAGRDEDFARGESPYDNYYGDPAFANPNLTEVAKPPFRALALTPGDLGTKGGLLTDPDARVLRADGSAIEGLYASGNVTSSVMGTDYAGPGATLGPAMTFAYLAIEHIAAGTGDEARTATSQRPSSSAGSSA